PRKSRPGSGEPAHRFFCARPDMPSEIGFSSDGSETPADLRTMVAIAEQGGASTIWLASHLFQREPIATAALALAATSKISIALMAMSPYSVHPLYATMAAA